MKIFQLICCNFGLRLTDLFSVGLVSPTASPFEAKSQLASSPARIYVLSHEGTIISHPCANCKILCKTNHLCKHRHFFFAQNLAYSKFLL